MSIPDKEVLRLYCQHNRLRMPIYFTSKKSISSHLWKTKIAVHDILNDNNSGIHKIKTFTTDYFSSKNIAENEASKMALAWLQTPKNDVITSNEKISSNKMLKKDTVMLTDNKDVAKHYDNYVLSSNFWIYIFTSGDEVYKNPQVTKIQNHNDDIGICMQMYLGMMLYDETFDVYLLHISNTFNKSLTRLITSPHHPWPPKSVFIMASADTSHIFDAIGYVSDVNIS